MANDKISLMTAAVGGDLAGTTTRIEVTTLYTTVPATLGCDLALLRTTMFAGGSGYTATDPLVCGTVGCAAITSTGLLTVTLTTQQLALRYDASNHLAVTVSSAGAVTYNATGASAGHAFSDIVGIMSAATAGQALTVAPANTLTGTAQYGVVSDVGASSAATSSVTAGWFRAGTTAAAFTTTNAYGLYVTDANKGAGSTITNAYGVYIAAQTAGGTVNMALYNAGKSQLMGAVGIGKAPTATSPFCATGIPTSAAGLASGDFWLNSNVLTIVP